MGIKVKHAPSAAAIGESAYTIGRGEKQRWATDVALKQQALGLQAASIRATAGARAAATEQREKESERLHGLREEELGFRRQQQEDEMGLRLQARIDATERYREENSHWGYTQSQLKELDRLDSCQAALEKEHAKGEWTDEGLQEGTRQIDNLKKHILLQRIPNSESTPEQILKSRTVNLPTGAQVLMDSKGDFKEMPGSISFQEFNRARADAAKAFTTTNLDNETIVDTKKADAFVEDSMYLFSQIQELPSRTEAIQKIRADRLKKLADDSEQAAITEKAEMDRDVASLPRLFEEGIAGPKIGRKGGGKPRWTKDDVYGEEAYNKLFMKVSEAKPDIPPEVIKAELDEWWLAQYEKEKGQKFQKFQNPAEFKGAKTGGTVLDEATAMSILQEAGGDKDKARQIAKQRGYIF